VSGRGFVELQPCPRIRREHAERRAAAREHFIALVQRVILVWMHPHAEPLRHRRDLHLHFAPMRIGIARKKDRRRASLANQPFERRIGGTFADDQPPAFPFEIPRKRGETSALEFLPRRANDDCLAIC